MLPEFTITAHDLSDIHVVALRGELDVVFADGLADALVEVAGSTVVVDLSGLTFIDCSGVAALVLRGTASWPTDWANWWSLDRVRSSVRSWRSWGLEDGSWNGRQTGIRCLSERDLHPGTGSTFL